MCMWLFACMHLYLHAHVIYLAFIILLLYFSIFIILLLKCFVMLCFIDTLLSLPLLLVSSCEALVRNMLYK